MGVTQTLDILPESINNPEPSNGHFSFDFFGKGCDAIESQEVRDALFRWGLSESFTVLQFQMNDHFEPSEATSFFTDFFENNKVKQALAHYIGYTSPKHASVAYKSLQTEALSTSILTTPLENEGVVSHNGAIRGRIPEDCEGIEIVNKLREALFMQESELWDIFDASTRNELLFYIFKLFVLGGRSNQYDDTLQPYLDTTLALYKDLLTVKRNSDGVIQICSYAYLVESVGQTGQLFKYGDQPGNSCIVIVDPLTRRVTLLHNYWSNSFW